MIEPGKPSKKVDYLFVVPTELERKFIGDALTVPNSIIGICGFGPVVSAARTVQLVHQHQPKGVVLLGVAGVYDEMLEIGDAVSFSKVACYGVGAGSGDSFQPAFKMGWDHWSAATAADSITDTIPLEPLTGIPKQLLTVCAAAENSLDVELRLKQFPGSLAEDMEGFAVAAACKLCNVSVSIVRGFSNRAGDRNKGNWKIKEALESAVDLCNLKVGQPNLGQES